MLTKETAELIWLAHREIATGEKLLADLADAKKNNPYDPHAQNLRDAFGRGRQLQLGIPSGENSHRLLDVSPLIADAVIKSHIANKKAELETLNECAAIEINSAHLN